MGLLWSSHSSRDSGQALTWDVSLLCSQLLAGAGVDGSAGEGAERGKFSAGIPLTPLFWDQPLLKGCRSSPKGFCTAPSGDFVPRMAEASKGKC